MAEDEPAPYNDSHRALLQVFFAQSTLTFDEAKPILASIFSIRDDRETLVNDITEADFTTYVGAINSAISPLDYEIRSTVPQTKSNRHGTESGTRISSRVYSLVNTTSDAFTQLATIHTPDEIGYVKRLLDAMFETYNTPREEVMAITSLQALRLNRAARSPQSADVGSSTGGGAPPSQSALGQGLTKHEAERMLESLVAEGWFELSANGYYTLSPRALMELRGWLIETYNEEAAEDEDGEPAAQIDRIKVCQACREIVTVGQRCADLDCVGRLHDRCVNRVFRAQRDEKICPMCKRDWDGQTFVGERAARELTARRRSGAAAAGASSSSRRQTTNGAAAAGESGRE